ncbi:hypothetical protein F5Y09DRAFT_353289 [Xylaria sp. FL1042]|nr:hypothetical protein F5Y09DRAFT_353289 [Xylaria sp. FL1042]
MSGLAPPPGGYIDPSTDPISPKAALLVGPVTVFYVLDLVVLAFRVWARRIKKATWRFSDYAIFIAAVFATGYVALCWIAVAQGGIGYPLVKVALPQRLLVRKVFFVAWLLQCYANTFVRLSILDFILQVFSPVRKFRLAVYLFEAASVAYLVAFTIADFSDCRPFKYNWELGPEVASHCGDQALKFLLSSIFNLILDAGILVLPLPMLWTLQMSTQRKVAVTFVFGLGTFVVFSTAWRTYNVVEFSRPVNQMNFTVAIIPDALWSGLEITLGIINACLPVMQPATHRVLGTPFVKLLSFSSSRSAKSSKASTGYSSSFSYSRFRSWVRLASSKDKNTRDETKVEI